MFRSPIVKANCKALTRVPNPQALFPLELILLKPFVPLLLSSNPSSIKKLNYSKNYILEHLIKNYLNQTITLTKMSNLSRLSLIILNSSSIKPKGCELLEDIVLLKYLILFFSPKSQPYSLISMGFSLTTN